MSEKAKPKYDSAMLVIGYPRDLKAAADGIVACIKASTSEAVQLAAMRALVELERAPSSVTVSGCHFENKAP